MKRSGSWLFALIIILAMVLSACGSEAAPETINATMAPDPGSSAVQDPGSPNLSYAVAEDIDTAFNSFLDAMVGYNSINPAGLNEMLAEEPPPFLLDVRSITEVAEYGYIEGAQSSRCSSSEITWTFCHHSTPPSLPTAAAVGAVRSP
jgi:ABC-type transport system substrate-binding protein